MRYYEVLVADGRYRSNLPLVYSHEGELVNLSVVTIPLRARMVTGFVTGEVTKPSFAAKPIKSVLSPKPLPYHCVQLAEWLSEYYACSLGEALRQFAPSKPAIRKIPDLIETVEVAAVKLDLKAPLTIDQTTAIEQIQENPSTTILLHGETATGKTRVYLELAKKTLDTGRSVIILTPEISLTTQLAKVTRDFLSIEPVVLHSQITDAVRKQIWLDILESEQPQVIIGPRSAIFTPLASIGLIVLDEAHEPAYKQEQSPRYQASRVASQLGALTGAKVILGTATPLITDYYLADAKSAIVRMKQPAGGSKTKITTQVVDLKDRGNFGSSQYLSKKLIDEINTTLSAKKQVLIYLNRRGSARMILCKKCGWQFLCPNCDVPVVYHGDEHMVRCHICGFNHSPPMACLKCNNPDIIYKSIGTKALADEVTRLFPNHKVHRFDSDNLVGERLNELYDKVRSGEIDILVGTQLLAKGLDLPKLGLVGIVSAEAAALPDYTAEERTFQLIYQVIGRVGRGHSDGQVIVQSYEPDSVVIKSSVARDWTAFYKHSITERQQFRFPPFSYLLKLTCRRATIAGAEKAANTLKKQLGGLGLPIEIIGPSPGFYGRRGKYFYYQLVAKSKNRDHLVKLAAEAPADWTIDLDPADLL
jgi:primosomal protein N' (replication factor Y)